MRFCYIRLEQRITSELFPIVFTLSSRSVPSLKEQLEKQNVLIVDCRSAGECAKGDGYKGAINIPVGETAARMAECGCDKTRPVVTYCGAGVRAAAAADVLKQHGFTDVLSAPNANALRAVKP